MPNVRRAIPNRPNFPRQLVLDPFVPALRIDPLEAPMSIPFSDSECDRRLLPMGWW